MQPSTPSQPPPTSGEGPTPIVKSPTLSKRAELFIKIAIAIISPLLLIGLLEGAAYIWERGQANDIYAWELVASRRLDFVQYTQPDPGYTLMVPNSSYKWQGIPVEINDKGLRTPETSYKKLSNTFRILNVGDSIAMGWGVREEETYGQQLEDLLNQQTDNSITYEVINAGVPGWNPANALAYLQAEGMMYEPDLILFDLTIPNDIYGKSALVAHERPPLIEWLRANTYFWPFLTIQLRWIEARSQGRDRIAVIDPPIDAASYFPLELEDQQYQKIWASLEAMHQLAQQNNAHFALLLFPLEFQVLDKNYPTTPQEFFTAKAAEAGFPALDLLPVFQQACLERAGGTCRLEDRHLFADVWMHPSAYGHELVAQEILSSIISPVD